MNNAELDVSILIMRSIYSKILSLALISIALSACASLETADRSLYRTVEMVSEKDRVTGVRMPSYRDREAQIRQSKKEVRSIISDLKDRGLPYNRDLDAKAFDRVREIADRILAVSHLADEKGRWQVFLLPGDEVNAFVTGGTEIMVYEGLVRELQDDDALAVVIGHEIAHVAANHIGEREATISLVKLADRKRGSASGYREAFTASDEREADQLGLLYVVLAGYDPAASLTFWRQSSSSDAGYRYFRSHPTALERASSAEKTSEMLAEYRIPGRANPRSREILACNTLWCPSETDSGGVVEPGSGGGVLAVLETGLSAASRHLEAMTERRRQQIEIASGGPRSKENFTTAPAAAEVLTYEGRIRSGGRPVPVMTQFLLPVKNGEREHPLEGRYLVKDKLKTFEGRLRFSHAIADRTLAYRWQDPFGAGTAVFEFQSDGSGFSGRWYRPDGKVGGNWTGDRSH